MIIKKYIGRDEKEAVEAARQELGSGVVVMNVKSVKTKGVFSSLKPRQIEVTVALEEEDEKFAPIRRESLSVSGRQGEAAAHAPSLKKDEKDSAVIEQKLDSLQNLLVSQMQLAEGRREELPEKKEAAAEKLPEKEPEEEEDSELVKFMKLLYNTMIDNEVDEKYANQIMEEIEKLNKHNMPFDYTLANTYQKMILKFGKIAGITQAGSGPKVVLFIGPTGVGKTTTIAKIASSFIMEEKKKVALLTADTYRIAAAEQLRTYANILEAPFRVIYTEEELQTAVRDFRDYDYIFVDTSGHSHHNEELNEKMKKLIHSIDGLAEKQVFLVLSATTKYRDLIRIADNYKDIADYQLIFTKLDETTSLGNLLNLKLYTDTAIAYVTLGQNVPDDIEVFNPQKTVKQLLGGKKQ